MFWFLEPSFYGKGEFGMRLENTMFITTVRIPWDATHSDFFIYKIGLKLNRFVIICIWLQGQCEKPCFVFRQLVFLPYEPNLIKPELFSDDQVHVLAFNPLKQKMAIFTLFWNNFCKYSFFFIEVVVKRLL